MGESQPAGHRLRRFGGALACALVLASCGGGGDDAATASGAARDGATTAGAPDARAGAAPALKTALPAAGTWGPRIVLPLVPASAANLPDGKVLLWSADDRFNFSGNGQAYTAVLDPVTGQSTERFVNLTGQNMFCPGTTNLPDGRILVSGGSNAEKTSVYDPLTGAWSVAAPMRIPRAYQANTLLRDGAVFTLGGSWAGGVGDKHGEMWTEAAGWNLLTGVRVDDFLTADPAGAYRADNHMWLLPAGNGQVFHAGPSTRMHWIDTTGVGRVQAAGPRGDDADSMSGNAVMYDAGKVLKVGGSPAYQDSNATPASYVIDIRAEARVRKLRPMAYARAFHNSVVLPNGQVMVVGGQSHAVPFSDNTSVLPAELWDPASETFTTLAPMSVPRNYHSIALLLPDARVISAGGGLCGAGCATNHADAQIFTPHYLFNEDGSAATRPVITEAPASATYGSALQVATDGPIAAFSLVRMSSVTHTVNNDQRRLALRHERTGDNRYAVAMPTNPGWALPGKYMLFALNADGVPSVARIVTVGANGAPRLAPVAEQSSFTGRAVSLGLAASGATRFEVTNLPPGVAYDAGAQALRGTPSVPGRYTVTVLAGNAAGATSTDFLWRVDAAGAVRFVKLEQLSEVNGNPWGAMAELNLLDAGGQVLPRAGWKLTADSEERIGENAAIANAVDGDPNTFWHTQYTPTSTDIPHSVVVDMGATQRLGGLRYLPRPGGFNGTMARFRIYVSADGVAWGNPLVESDFRLIDANNAAEKTVRFDVGVTVNYAPVVNSPGDLGNQVGDTVALDIVASDDQAEPLRFAATGLPPGLTLNADTGAVAGRTTTSGTFAVTFSATDRAGVTTQTAFTWRVQSLVPPTPSVAAPVITGGATAVFTAQVAGDASNLRFAWDFGDGSPATGYDAAPGTTHRYDAPGLYTVTVRVRGADGQESVTRFTQAVAGAIATGSAAPGATTAIAWEPGTATQGARLWVVNPDNDSVSVFDGTTSTRLAEVAVGRAPRTLTLLPALRQVWVANRDGASITVIDTATRAVLRTIALPAASQPWGIVAAPAGDRVYVSLEATARVLQLDASGATLGALALPGTPRHIAVSANGGQLLVSRFVSAPQPGEETATVRTTRDGVATGGEVWAVATATLALQKTVVLAHGARADSTTQGRGVPNYLGAAAIAPDGLSAWVPSKQDNIQRGRMRDGLDLNFENTVRAIDSRIALGTLAEDAAARIDHDNASLASASVFHPSGAYLFTALETSRQIAVVDPVGRRELFRVDAGRAPQGLAVSSDGRTLFVANFMDRSVGVYDLRPLTGYGQLELPARATLATVATEKLTAPVLRGKQLFYDARDTRLARDGYMSCASCHSDGGHDGRTWDFTSLGEGLRNTTALRGHAQQGRLHWSGNADEVQDFEGQIRALAGGTGLLTDAQLATGTRAQPLGDAKAGVSTDLDALAAYVGSLDTFAASPARQADGSLTALAVTGRTVFQNQCVSCHGGTAFTASAAGVLQDVGTLKATSGTRLGAPLTGLDIPTLRDVWATAPYLHDGSAATVEDAVRAHTRLPVLSAADLASVSAFARQIGGTEAAVGPPATATGVRGRYVRFEALSEVAGNPWTSMAEFYMLDKAGQPLSRTGWRITGFDTQETAGEDGQAANVLDGNASTIWHTTWSSGNAPYPHWIVVDTGAVRDFGGFRYQPRSGVPNGTVDGYRLSVSTDGVAWGQPVKQGNLSALGAPAATKSVLFGG
ncbi:MAG TPA: discoidin domain-containing protein [Variovorax sp.]|nr:discoidin domain-containing protein [Variovorax sp.]